MSESNKERVIMLLLHDGSKLEGVLLKIDKENLKMILVKGKQYIKDSEPENFERKEISKKDIKEIRVIEEKEVNKINNDNKKVNINNDNSNNNIIDKNNNNEDINNNNQQNKLNNESSTFNSIPKSIQNQYQQSNSKYDKGDFFDALSISNNKDNYRDVKTYNEKNKDTFGIDDTKEVSYRRRRGGGYRGYRGRGGYNDCSNRGGYYYKKDDNNYNNNSNYYYKNNYNNGNNTYSTNNVKSNYYGVKNDYNKEYSNEIKYGYDN